MDATYSKTNLCGETICSSFIQLKDEEKKAAVCRYVYGFTRRELRSFGLTPVVLEPGAGLFAPAASEKAAQDYGDKLTGMVLLQRYKNIFKDLFGNDFEDKVSGILKRRERNTKIRKLSKRCFLVSLALILVFLSVLGFSEDLRVRAISGVVNNLDIGSFINIRYTTEENRNQLSTFTGDSMPQVIPRDYYIEKIENYICFHEIVYRSFTNADAYLLYSEMRGENYVVDISTEDAKVDYIQINGNECMQVTRPRTIILSWKKDKQTLAIIESHNNLALDVCGFAKSVK